MRPDWLVQAALLCAAAALILTFLIPVMAAAAARRRRIELPDAVALRGLERRRFATEAELHACLDKLGQHGRSVYRWPVLIPGDLLFALSLAAFAAFGAMALSPAEAWWKWVWLLCPAVYLGADWVEDGLLVVLLGDPARTGDLMRPLVLAFRVKVAGALFTLVQPVVASLIALVTS